MFRGVPGCSGVFRCSGIPVCSGVPACFGVPVFRCSGVPVFLVLVHALLSGLSLWLASELRTARYLAGQRSVIIPTRDHTSIFRWVLQGFLG